MLSRHIRREHENTRISMPMLLFEEIIGFDYRRSLKPFLRDVNISLISEENQRYKIIEDVNGGKFMKYPFPKFMRLFLGEA
jgi:hypothetical protein